MSDPTNVEIYNDIGNAYKAKGMDKEAEGYFSCTKTKKSGPMGLRPAQRRRLLLEASYSSFSSEGIG